MSEIAETRPLNAKVWAREPNDCPISRAIEVGTAGEHLVCADLILQGHRAFMSGAGLPFDIVAEVDGLLIKIAVKSTRKLIQRPAREGNRVCYHFSVTRPRKVQGGKTDARPYNSADVDIVALCALDVRRVAYCHFSECATCMHFDPIGSPVREMYKGKIPGRDRKTFETFTFIRALEIHSGHRAPSILKGRS